jgi:hypothetical protein
VLQSLILARRYLEQYLGEPIELPAAEAQAPARPAGVVAL